jgi:hypothetical protein
MTRRIHSQSGYVLLLTLLVLALAGAALVSVGRMSLAKAREAIAAERELQRRWGTLSCRSTLLPNAERLLLKAESRSAEPVQLVRAKLELARFTYQVSVSDEQAKININSLYDQLHPQRAESAERVLSLHADKPITVRLRPLANRPTEGARSLPAFASWGQVFVNPPPMSLFPQAGRDHALADFTCWGNGQLNLRRASEQSLQAACESTVGDVRPILYLRQRYPGLGIDTIARELKLDGPREAALRQTLTTGSSCHAVWIVVRSEKDRQSFYHLAVHDRTAQPRPREYAFSW